MSVSKRLVKMNLTQSIIRVPGKIKAFFQRHVEEQYLKSFFRNVRHDENKKGKILMYVGISSMYLTPVELLFYHQLKKKNFDVDYYIYDDSITINEVITKARYETEGNKQFWRRSFFHGIKKLNAAGVDYQFIETDPKVDLILQSREWSLDEILSFSHEGVNFGNIVEGSMYRFYKSLKFDADAIKYGKEFLRTSLINYFQVKKLVEQNTYHSILFSHGIYCTWQPVVELLGQKKIDYVCYDRGKTKGHININLNNPSPVWDISSAWARYKDRKINKEELAAVEQYLSERILQKGDVYAYNFGGKAENIDEVRQSLGIRAGSKVICIFTNLIWDAANVARDVAFESPLSCIRETINRYQDQPNVHILIRTHPAERVLGTAETYGGLIRYSMGQLPQNVTIIEPDMNINSFTILEIADIGVVHTSTVGLEMAIEGKPVILISDTHYRDKGFTFDAMSPVDYFHMLDKQIVESFTKREQVELAKKYFYLMMFKYQHKTPIIYKSGSFKYTYRHFEQMIEDETCALNQVADEIANGIPRKDFVHWN